MAEKFVHPMILRLDHIQLAMPQGQESAAEKFYCGVLGFKRQRKPPNLEKRGGCWFECNGVTVHLGLDEPFVPAKKAHPAFVVTSLKAVRAHLEGAGYKVVQDEPLPGYERFYSHDAFGNRLEFMEVVDPGV